MIRLTIDKYLDTQKITRYELAKRTVDIENKLNGKNDNKITLVVERRK